MRLIIKMIILICITTTICMGILTYAFVKEMKKIDEIIVVNSQKYIDNNIK